MKIRESAKRLMGEVAGEDRLKSMFAIRQLIQKVLIRNGEEV